MNARLWAGAMLKGIAKVPAGEKLNIRALRDPLGISQAEALAAIEMLIAEGRLDRMSLRPSEPIHANRSSGPSPLAAWQAAHPSGAALADALERYVKAHGLAMWRVSEHLSLGRSGAARLRRTTRPRQATINKVRACLAAEPDQAWRIRPTGGARVPKHGVTGAGLAARLDALIAEHGLSKSAVGLLIYSNVHGVERLRLAMPHRKTIAKVEALLADPPIAQLRRKPSGRTADAVRKPTRRRESPPAVRIPREGIVIAPPAAVDEPVRERIDPEIDGAPMATFLQPAEIAWCSQCDQRVSGVKAGACRSRWCSLKQLRNDQRGEAA